MNTYEEEDNILHNIPKKIIKEKQNHIKERFFENENILDSISKLIICNDNNNRNDPDSKG